MVYRRKIQICTDGVWRTHALDFEFHVEHVNVEWKKDAPPRFKAHPVVTKTTENHGSFTADKSWFWDMCPGEVSERLDREMLEYAAEEGQGAA